MLAAKAEVASCAVETVNEAMTLAGGIGYEQNSVLAMLLGCTGCPCDVAHNRYLVYLARQGTFRSTTFIRLTNHGAMIIYLGTDVPTNEIGRLANHFPD